MHSILNCEKYEKDRCNLKVLNILFFFIPQIFKTKWIHKAYSIFKKSDVKCSYQSFQVYKHYYIIYKVDKLRFYHWTSQWFYDEWSQ